MVIVDEAIWGAAGLGSAAGIADEKLSASAAAAAALFDQLSGPVYRYLLGINTNPADAEDVTQEVFLRLYRELSRRRVPPNARAWAFRVAHNLAVDRWRTGARTCDPPEAAAERADPAADTERILIEREAEERLARALSWLSPQQRQCLELRAEGLRYREIAQVLGLQISTVRTFIARAVAKIAGKADA